MLSERVDAIKLYDMDARGLNSATSRNQHIAGWHKAADMRILQEFE